MEEPPGLVLEGGETPLGTERRLGNADARARSDSEGTGGARRAHASGLAGSSPDAQPAGRVGARDALASSMGAFPVPQGCDGPSCTWGLSGALFCPTWFRRHRRSQLARLDGTGGCQAAGAHTSLSRVKGTFTVSKITVQ